MLAGAGPGGLASGARQWGHCALSSAIWTRRVKAGKSVEWHGLCLRLARDGKIMPETGAANP